MSIEFHCPMCRKLIRAPATAGGKRGKCPYCKESVYVPMPPEEREEIPLAPLDPNEEAREHQLLDEARRLTTALDKEEPAKYDTGGEVPDTGSGVVLPRDFDVDVPESVNDFLAAMAASDMGRADVATRQLKKHAAEAKEHVRQLIAEESPSADLGNIPLPVYKGFLRSLLELL
ncbi:MAG: hypothetical protein V2A79_12160 [Planctomycetota bacterium]